MPLNSPEFPNPEEKPSQLARLKEIYLRNHGKIAVFVVLLNVIAHTRIQEFNYRNNPEGMYPLLVEMRNNLSLWKAELEGKSAEAKSARVIQEEIGPAPIARMLNRHSLGGFNEGPKLNEKPTEIVYENLDKIFPEFSESDIKAIILGLPKGLNIRKVSYEDKLLEMSKDYGLSKEGKVSHEAAHVYADDGEIVFTKGVQTSDPFQFLQVIFHEAGHCADPLRNKFLTLKERFWLQRELINRLKSDNRFKSSYVEEINNENKRREMDIKCREYFAEIFAMYMMGDLPFQDQIIVEFVIKKLDPNFNLLEARNKQFDIAAKAFEKREANPLLNKMKTGASHVVVDRSKSSDKNKKTR